MRAIAFAAAAAPARLHAGHKPRAPIVKVRGIPATKHLKARRAFAASSRARRDKCSGHRRSFEKLHLRVCVCVCDVARRGKNGAAEAPKTRALFAAEQPPQCIVFTS